ncbi:hypothetical protein VSS74_30615 [Conexibacter stalactiti]|uniref:Uncharacterized protein n=1 Tax=Conexibacter stalactiti TaxID=1940611 RepID=A0ABU4HZL0_9ACTN|nr:hypothetical protein [Conexibacter stalactiti]MDW5598752.1 hypothetical protein [Conexibacter stalactiti]MEC5039394.1 hypothetical protein [Conexibacter stalactiti]
MRAARSGRTTPRKPAPGGLPLGRPGQPPRQPHQASRPAPPARRARPMRRPGM